MEGHYQWAWPVPQYLSGKLLRWLREDPISTARCDPLYRPLPAITLTLVTHTYESHDHDS